MRRIYLDMCALKRPFDDRSQPRVWLEAQAVGLIVQAVQDGQLELVTSSLLDYENSQNFLPLRRNAAAKWLGLASVVQKMTSEVEQRGGELEGLGLRAVDALHLACAEAADVDVFVTCDDRARQRYAGKLSVLLPTECALALQEESDGSSSTQ